MGRVAFASLQIDEGQSKDTATGKTIFFVGRFGRTNALGTAGNMVSKDRVVIWDAVSDDGVTINTSTTSNDSLAAGVTMDDIPGSSRDNTATLDLSYPNWGRIQTWGKHAAVSWDQSTAGGASSLLAVGSMVGNSARGTGTAGMYLLVSGDSTRAAISKDTLGFLLNSPAATDKTADIFIRR